jgi:Spi protease inhibitor/Peptidase C10 family
MKAQLFTFLRSGVSFLVTRKILLIYSFSVTFFFGCKPVDEQVLEIQKIPFEVSLDEAEQVATKYDLTSKKNVDSKNLRIEANSDVDKKETIVDENKSPLFHVLNYAKGGFIIVSADLRTIPVLAFADKGSFETKEIPDGVKQWFDESKDKVKKVKKDNKDADPIIVKAWKEYLKGELNLPIKKGGRISNDCWQSYNLCQSYTSSNGPLLSTNWGQAGYSTGYLGSCPSANACNKYNAGCGPVALAQIMNYYQKPNWFTYAGMPANYARSDCNPSTPQQWELARLMVYCGSASGLNASYGFWGTTNTFSWPSNIPDALSNYGYSGNGSSTDLISQVVKNEVFGGHPVILWGTSGWIGSFSNYHIWVCDGILSVAYRNYDCATMMCSEWGGDYYHMNWGWHGDWNAWYVTGNLSPGGTNYNSNIHMIYGIRP